MLLGRELSVLAPLLELALEQELVPRLQPVLLLLLLLLLLLVLLLLLLPLPPSE